MDVSARVSSRGQITIPHAVREALSIREGDEVLFRVEGQRAMIARSPDLIQLAGSVSVPARNGARPGMRYCAKRGGREQPLGDDGLR